jgi:hypothetical protein
MAEPTVSLQTLRRAIAKELEMPFFKRYKNGFLDTDSGTTTTLVDAALTQKDKFWNGAWVYRVASQEASQITNFDATDDKLSLEVPITTFASGDDYEIHSIWNAYDIHEAINAAIRDSRRVFFETVTDETIIVEEDQLEYSLSSLAKTPHIIQKIWLEQPTSVKRGTVVSATSTTVFFENSGVLSDVNTNWKVSIYAGTGSGQIKSISVVDVPTAGIVIVGSFSTTPDATSKYALWNPTQQIQDWRPWHAVRYDSMKEFPDVLYFSARPTDFQGLRIRLEYVALPAELSAEADTTVIPQSYLVPAAISKLHSRKVKDTKVDRELHFAESKRHQEIADAWMLRNAPHRPDSNILNQASTGYQPSPSDPLNWNNS